MSTVSAEHSIQASYLKQQIPSRVLALVLDVPLATPALLESLLRFSPKLQAREDRSTGFNKTLVFLDLACQASWMERHFVRGEQGLLEEVQKTLRVMGIENTRMAVADTAPAAQALANAHFYWISKPGSSPGDLERLPLHFIRCLEGLELWPNPSRLDGMTDFFSVLGFQTIGDLNAFTASAFHERWGEIGDRVHRRLKAIESLDPQPIQPYVATEPLQTFLQLDFPVSLASLLLHELDGQLRALFLRMEGRRLLVRRLKVLLRCEYSDCEHRFEIEPSVPSRDVRFFAALLENRLEKISLNSSIFDSPMSNPIKDIEIRVDPLPEKETQDEWLDSTARQRVDDAIRIDLLTSLLKQEGIAAGFAKLQDHVWPEDSWTICPDPPKLNDLECFRLRSGQFVPAQGELTENGFAPLTHYGAGLLLSPRPSLMLSEPKRLASDEQKGLRFLSERPIERIETGWWRGRDGPGGARHYFIARDPEGRHLWIFKKDNSESLFLHGIFD